MMENMSKNLIDTDEYPATRKEPTNFIVLGLTHPQKSFTIAVTEYNLVIPCSP
jgi:hypothetical protein